MCLTASGVEQIVCANVTVRFGKRIEMRRLMLLIALVWAAPVSAQENVDRETPIIVTGERAEQAERAADQARAITLRPSADNPLPRRYAPLCLKLFGIDAAYGAAIAERIQDNVRTLRLTVGGGDCQPNIWIGFVRDSRAAVRRLSQEAPELFSSLKSFEIDRIFRGSGKAQLWNATEIRNRDGRSIPVFVDGQTGAEYKSNSLYQTGRLTSPIRSDINGTILLFDSGHANGHSVRQLADYATFRILAPVQDFAEVPQGGMASILTLFTEGAAPPDGLTDFDWAYLSAYYRLDRGAKASAVHDAVKRTVLDGSGQRLREQASAE